MAQFDPDNFLLRSPTLVDLPKLTRLGAETFTETFGHLYSPEDLQVFLEQVYSDRSVTTELNDPRLTFQVLEDPRDQELVGYVKLGPVHVPIENPPHDAMEVWQLYVRRRLMGRGLGLRLMNWANAEFTARGIGEVYVSVFSENELAIKFYRRQGFEKIGEYGFVVGEQIDHEWIMRRGK